jgi:hypothetical protein
MNGGNSAYGEVRMGDVVRMRKPHPCGSSEWQVVRLGADIGIRCGGCGRRVLLPRSQFMRQVKALVKQGAPPDAQAAA